MNKIRESNMKKRDEEKKKEFNERSRYFNPAWNEEKERRDSRVIREQLRSYGVKF